MGTIFQVKRPVDSPSPFYPASVVLFQLHGGMVSHMQVLATPSSIVHNTKYLDPYHRDHISYSCFFMLKTYTSILVSVELFANRDFKVDVPIGNSAQLH